MSERERRRRRALGRRLGIRARRRAERRIIERAGEGHVQAPLSDFHLEAIRKFLGPPVWPRFDLPLFYVCTNHIEPIETPERPLPPVVLKSLRELLEEDD